MQLFDFGAHLHAQFGVEIGQRLVEKEHLRVAHDRPAHGHALTLPTRQLTRKTLEQLRQPEDRRGAVDTVIDLALRRAAQFHGERHVGGDRHMRVERIVLKNHGHVTLFRRQIVDDALTDSDFTRGDVFQACDHPQQSRFAAAGGTDQHNELAIAYRNVDAMDDACCAKGLAYVADRDRSHSLLPGRSQQPLTQFSLFSGPSARMPRYWNTRAEQIIGLSPAEKQARLAACWATAITVGRLAAKAPCRHRRGAVGP